MVFSHSQKTRNFLTSWQKISNILLKDKVIRRMRKEIGTRQNKICGDHSPVVGWGTSKSA